VSAAATHAGMYKGMTVRPNPRLRTVNAVLRTYITVLHIAHQQKDAMFAARGKCAAPRAARPLDAPATPGTPASAAGSEVASPVHAGLLPACAELHQRPELPRFVPRGRSRH
jgi:hypothetical protein